MKGRGHEPLCGQQPAPQFVQQIINEVFVLPLQHIHLTTYTGTRTQTYFLPENVFVLAFGQWDEEELNLLFGQRINNPPHAPQ